MLGARIPRETAWHPQPTGETSSGDWPPLSARGSGRTVDSGLALHPPKLPPSPSEGTVTAQPTPSQHSPSCQCDPEDSGNPPPAPQGLTQPQEMPHHPHLPPRLAAAASPTQHTHRATVGRSLPAVRSPRSVPIITGAPASGGRGRHESRSPCLRAHILAADAYLLLRGAHLRAPHHQSCHSHLEQTPLHEAAPPPQAAPWPRPGRCVESPVLEGGRPAGT